MSVDVTITDRSGEIIRDMTASKERALTIIGGKAEGYAKAEAPVDTGRLRNSIANAVQGDTAYIGTNVEYAPYQELGTTRIAPKHFLQDSVQNHIDEYRRIAEEELKR